MKTTEKVMAVTMFTAIGLTILLGAASCASSKQYHTCDAYKTHYPKIKADKHRSHKHGLCDAYN